MMNKQELIELLEKEINHWTEEGKKLVHLGEVIKGKKVASHIDGLRFGLSTLKSLDDSKTQHEPQKVVVPKFVADWYEEVKHDTLLVKFTRAKQDEDERVTEWYNHCPGRHRNFQANAQEIIARMDLEGYEIEKEPLYRVELPQFQFDEESGEMKTVSLCLAWDFQSDETRLISFVGSNTTRFKTNLTEAEIKSIDERFWAFAVPVEEG